MAEEAIEKQALGGEDGLSSREVLVFDGEEAGIGFDLPAESRFTRN